MQTNVVKFAPAEREITLQSVPDLMALIQDTHDAIEQQIINIQAAAGYLVGSHPDPTKAKTLLTQVRGDRAEIIAQIRAGRSGLLNLQAAVLAAWQAAGEPAGAIRERVAEWQVTMHADFLIQTAEAAMMTLPDPVPLLLAKYPEEECSDPLLPESSMLGEDPAFLETVAERFNLNG